MSGNEECAILCSYIYYHDPSTKQRANRSIFFPKINIPRMKILSTYSTCTMHGNYLPTSLARSSGTFAIVEEISLSTLKISVKSSVNSGPRNQKSGCKQRYIADRFQCICIPLTCSPDENSTKHRDLGNLQGIGVLHIRQ